MLRSNSSDSTTKHSFEKVIRGTLKDALLISALALRKVLGILRVQCHQISTFMGAQA